MAKRKTPKAKDLKPTSITKEQLESIRNIITPINNLQVEIGRIETQKHLMLHKITMLQESLQEENTALTKQYGNVKVNIEDGTIKYPESE